jgi:hypothetical protein
LGSGALIALRLKFKKIDISIDRIILFKYILGVGRKSGIRDPYFSWRGDMAGQIKKLIDNVVQARSKGNIALATITRAKLAFKGINPDKYTDNSPDDPAVLAKLQSLAEEFSARQAPAANDAAPRPERGMEAREAARSSVSAGLESRMSELRQKYGQRDFSAERWTRRFSDASTPTGSQQSLIEEENRRLRNGVADLQIEIQALKEMLGRRV